MRGLVVSCLLAGCDAVFGVSAFPDPLPATPLCTPSSFEGAQTSDIIPIDDYSMPEDRSFAFVVSSGIPAERDTATGKLTPVDLGPYSVSTPMMSPEGDVLYFELQVEPFQLSTAERTGTGKYQPDGRAPPGMGFGLPTALR